MKKAIIKSSINIPLSDIDRIREAWRLFADNSESDAIIIGPGLDIIFVEAQLVDGELVLVMPDGTIIK